MFDFTNYTYSGLLSVLSALFGLACPLVISMVENIDKRYHSTLLSKRFMQESISKASAFFLIINLMVAILFPFLLDGSTHSRILISIQSCLFVLLVGAVFLLFYKMLLYVDPSALQTEILRDYHSSKGNKSKEELYFNQWVDLTETLLLSSDSKIAQSVYQEWYNYVSEVNHSGDESGVYVDFDDYFLDAISRINETLCRTEHRPISVNNGNSILTSLLSYHVPLTDKRFTHLWRNLRIQLFYNRDEWIMEYWKDASQIYQMFMRERKEDEKWRFLEFHLMLCAMLLEENKYDLVRQMLSYSNTKPESYPLVPSTMTDILMCFKRINSTSNDIKKVMYYEQHYPMPNMYGISEGQILGAVYSFLTLLMYRVYTLNHVFGTDHVFHVGVGTNTLAELRNLQESLQIIKYWLPKVKMDNKLLRVINVEDSEEKTFNKTRDGHSVSTPDNIIKLMETEILKRMKDLRENQDFDSEKVEDSKQQIVQNLARAVKPYQILFNGDRSQKLFSKTYRCDNYQLFENTAYLPNPDIGCCGIEETMSDGAFFYFKQSVALYFFQRTKEKIYTILYDELLTAIDKLKLTDHQAVLSMGFSWENIVNDNLNAFEIVNEGQYRHKNSGVIIYDFPHTISEPLNNWLYILNTKDLPAIDFQNPTDSEYKEEQLIEYNHELGIWMSLIKLKENATIRERYKAQLGEDVDKYFQYTLCWRPTIHAVEQYKITAIRVWRKFWDEGNYDDVNSIVPFEAN